MLDDVQGGAETVENDAVGLAVADTPQPAPVEGAAPVEGEQEGVEPAPEPVVAPASLNAEGKAIFATLPPEAQKWWSDTETTRARQVTEATTRAAERQRAAETQAKQARVEAQSAFAKQLHTFASAYQPQQPNPANYQDMQQYARDHAQWQHDAQQHAQLMQQVQAIGAEADQGAAGLSQEHVQHEQRQLQAAFPEWFDETKGPEHRQRLTAIGAELGYTPELMAQAGAADVLALRTASSWKDKAEKYDRLMATRMAGVRAGKQPVPPNARGAALGATGGAPASVAATLYPDDVRR